MAEPEEESDEEWQKIADVVGEVERQVILARAQTAAGHAASARVHPSAAQLQPSPPQQQPRLPLQPPPPLQRLQPPQQPPQQALHARQHAAPAQRVQQPTPQQHLQPSPQLTNQQATNAHRVRPHTQTRPVPRTHARSEAFLSPRGETHVQEDAALRGIKRPHSAPAQSPPPHAPPHAQPTALPPPLPTCTPPPIQPQPQAPPSPQLPVSQAASPAPSATALITSLQLENAHLKREYTTRIRHLEAQLKTSRTHRNLRSQLALAERELRTYRARPPPSATQAHATPVAQTQGRGHGTRAASATQGEVVEGTQPVLTALPCEPSGAVAGFGCAGVDKNFLSDALRRELFTLPGVLTRPAAAGAARLAGLHDWRALVGHLAREAGGSVNALKAVSLVLREREAREAFVGLAEGVVAEVVNGAFEVGGFGYDVLEGVLLAAGEVGDDAVRRVVTVDERVVKGVKGRGNMDGGGRGERGERGRGNGRAERFAVSVAVAILEVEDGRVSDREWGTLESLVTVSCERVRRIGTMETGRVWCSVLGTTSVLAAELAIRCGALDALLDGVGGLVVRGVDEGVGTMLAVLVGLLDEARVVGGRVSTGVKVVAMAPLVALVRRGGAVGELACRVVNGIYRLHDADRRERSGDAR